jgi:hypothetical protein
MTSAVAFISVYAGQIFQETSKNIFIKIFDIMNEKHDYIKEIIDMLDLVSKVEIIESIIRDINDYMKIHNIKPNHTLELAIIQLSDIITIIHSDLNNVKNGVEYHKTLWFNYIRTPEYLKIINKIKLDKKTLDSRLDNMIKVITIFREINYVSSRPTTSNPMFSI